MTTQFDTDVDRALLIQYDFATPCMNEPCKRDAEWVLRAKCCGTGWPVCKRCLDISIEVSMTATNNRICNVCDAILKPKDMYILPPEKL